MLVFPTSLFYYPFALLSLEYRRRLYDVVFFISFSQGPCVIVVPKRWMSKKTPRLPVSVKDITMEISPNPNHHMWDASIASLSASVKGKNIKLVECGSFVQPNAAGVLFPLHAAHFEASDSTIKACLSKKSLMSRLHCEKQTKKVKEEKEDSSSRKM